MRSAVQDQNARMDPKSPVDAVTHRDPYSYYERLLADSALQYDERLQLWIASQAATVSEVFANPACRVRPMSEPVPANLAGSSSGEIFGQLVRMNDGAKHERPKLTLGRALASLPDADVKMRAQRIAARTLPSATDMAALSSWLIDTPLAILADLLGFAGHEAAMLAAWTREFAACFSPLSTADQLSAGSKAASALGSKMQSLLRSTPARCDSLVARVRTEADVAGWCDANAIVANLVGTLTQTCEATAGLIGNSIVALATLPRLLGEVRRDTDGWAQLVHETSRWDPPVQNTRRFVVESTSIAGVGLQPNSAILLVLAAANRDPCANPRPQEFLLHRPNRCVFTFSRGAHSCPGESLARNIAAAVLATLFAGVPDGWVSQLAWSWRPSANIRLPVFESSD
ncbi:MAG TPA: cytochrome P450 [Steroidobacteraceae bacterium]